MSEENQNERSMLLLTRTVKFDAKGNVISDTITNHLTSVTMVTPKKRGEAS